MKNKMYKNLKRIIQKNVYNHSQLSEDNRVRRKGVTGHTCKILGEVGHSNGEFPADIK